MLCNVVAACPRVHVAGMAAWINREEERGGLTHAALADVDAGRVIDHQTVQVWADSLSSEAPLLVPR